MNTLFDFIGKYKPRVNQEIEAEIEKRLKEVSQISPHLTPILQAMKELSIGGKRLRAMLAILGYEISVQRKVGIVESDRKLPEDIIKAATVMELFHLGLLCWDDVFDRDGKRRGVATIHARYDDLHLGEAMAVSAGGFTFAWGLEILAKLDMDKDRVAKAMAVWGKYFARVGYGEALDVLTEQRGEITDKEMLDVMALKSGEYSCVLPLTLGATLGGADEGLITTLKQYGMELGWAFQLRDDYLSEFGDESKTGKPVGNDSREGKKTYATVYGKEKTEEAIEMHMKEANLIVEKMEQEYRISVGQILRELVEWVGKRDY